MSYFKKNISVDFRQFLFKKKEIQYDDKKEIIDFNINLLTNNLLRNMFLYIQLVCFRISVTLFALVIE